MTLTIDMSREKEDIKANEFRENRIETSVHLSFPQLNSSCRSIHSLEIKHTKYTAIGIDHLSRFT